MSKGIGKVQQFVLDELGRQQQPEKPAEWINIEVLIHALCKERGLGRLDPDSKKYKSVRATVKRAINSLWDRGLIERPYYKSDNRRFYYNRHWGEMQKTYEERQRLLNLAEYGSYDDGMGIIFNNPFSGIRCRLALDSEQRAELDRITATKLRELQQMW